MTTPLLQANAVVPLFRVADVARSIAWYSDVLGFDADPFPPTPPYEFAILRLGPIELMLRRSRGAGRRTLKAGMPMSASTRTSAPSTAPLSSGA